MWEIKRNAGLQHVSGICSTLTVTPSAFLALWNPLRTLHTISNSSEEKPGGCIYYSFLLSLPALSVDRNTFVDTHRCCTDDFRFLMEPVKSRTSAALPRSHSKGIHIYSLRLSSFSPLCLCPAQQAQASLLVSRWTEWIQRVLSKGGDCKNKSSLKALKQINVPSKLL